MDFQSALLTSYPNPGAAQIGMELIRWKPVLDIMALQLWPLIVEARRQLKLPKRPAPVILLGAPPTCEQGRSDSGPVGFEFQTGQICNPIAGSSMRFLRGEGPELSLDHVTDNNVDNDSSSSSDASSELIEERARFGAARNRCANVLFFGRITW
jgi:hypothetical protein